MSDQNAPNSEFLLYTTDDGNTRIECRFENETIWLSQALMADLFQTTPQNITLHLKALYDDEELNNSSTCKEYLQVRLEGSREVKRQVKHYNLEAIIAVGFRVRSTRGSQFRRWANTRLQEFLVKGFVMDDERLKNPPVAGSSAVPDYFDEMLERIRDIRSSERRVYLRVREIFTLSADYSPSNKDVNRFFQAIQNKLHFAATGLTAAELINSRADVSQPNMGLTVWKGDIVLKGDVTTAKNYLSETEVSDLNRIVVMWLDFAEDQALRRQQIFLENWTQKLDDFLVFNERDVLQNTGSITKQQADIKAKDVYDKFSKQRREQLEVDGGEETIKALSQLANKNQK